MCTIDEDSFYAAQREARRLAVPDGHQLPEEALAAMIRQDLGVAVDADRLATFVRSRWTRVQRLAHRIHES